ncbi:MAG: hypothetical protein NT154_21720, partial [Verrucomicrobia bacterium]|nr:hypothetical protein [Verrucomicrobiota bacterium]
MHPDTTTKAGGYANRNAGFIRQPQCGSPGCRMNPAFWWRRQDMPTPSRVHALSLPTMLPLCYASASRMADARIEELKKLLPQCLLPDWVRLGRRLVRLLHDRHHPTQRDALLERLLQRVHASIALREERRLNVPRVSYPPALPITARKDEIVAAIRQHQVVVIAGETGSGKTTQLPKMCLEAGLGIEAKIGCTQPRRVAALSISQRIAEEL